MLIDEENFIYDLQRFTILQFQLKLPDPPQVFIDGGMSTLLLERFTLSLFLFNQRAGFLLTRANEPVVTLGRFPITIILGAEKLSIPESMLII